MCRDAQLAGTQTGMGNVFGELSEEGKCLGQVVWDKCPGGGGCPGIIQITPGELSKGNVHLLPNSSSANVAFRMLDQCVASRASGLNETQCVQTPVEDISV